MSIISDVQDLYGTLHTTWSKIRIHVISHTVVFAIVFWMGGLTLMNFSFPHIDGKDISDNDWFKLAKDTGIVYLILAVPIILISTYLAIFDIASRFLATAIAMLFLAPDRIYLTGLSANELLPIAMLLPINDFELQQVITKSSTIALKLKEQKPDDWNGFRKVLSQVSGDSLQYLGDFCILLLLWIIMFITLRSNADIKVARFWYIFFILSALVRLASMRASRALAAQPILQIKFVSAILLTNPSLTPADKMTDERREELSSRIDKMLESEKVREDRGKFSRPSFRRVFGLLKEPKEWGYVKFTDRDKLSLFDRGRRLDRYGSPKDLSVADVVAYKLFSARST